MGAILVGESSTFSYSPPLVESRVRNSRVDGYKRRANVNSLMGFQTPEEADNFINDSHIANMNQVFLSRACEVVCDSVNLGVTFEESEGNLCEVTEYILCNL